MPSTRSLWKIHFYGDCRVSNLAVTAMGSPKWGGVGDARTRELYVIFKIFSLCHFMLTLVWGTLAHLTESVLRECVPVLQTVCASHPTNHCVETLAFKCWGFAKRLGHEGGVLINRINTNKKKVRDSHVHSFGHVRTHQTDPYEPRSRLTPDTKCQLFELGLPNLWNGEKYVSLLCKPTQFVGFFL